MLRSVALLLPLWLFLGISGRLSAGTYIQITDCNDMSGCSLGELESGHDAQPFGIVHPLGYTGTETSLDIKVCVDAADPDLVRPAQRAIAAWNALTGATQNCTGCVLFEEPPAPTGKYHAESALLHELGHCAMGLDHIDRVWDVAGDGFYENTSFTRSANALSIVAGTDGIRGTNDDEHVSTMGQPADSVAWFRISDNNPVVVDATVIDKDSFSRSVAANLPAGHSWAANGNRAVAESLGENDTQTVMYALLEPETRYSGLSADDVNMVKMGMTGVDLTAGTADDYTVTLTYVADCALADIRVSFEPALGAVGACENLSIAFSFTQNPLLGRHYSVVRSVGAVPLMIVLDEDKDWNFGAPDLVITKDDGGITADPGDTIIYTLSVENVGAEDANGVVLTDVVPAGTVFAAGGSHPSWSCSDIVPGSVCTLAVGMVTQGAGAQMFAFALTVDSPTTVAEVMNTATAADNGASGPDEDPTNNTATDLTPVDVPCGGTEDLVLTVPGVDPVVVHEACNSITAGTTFTIEAGRDVTFKARNLIGLTDGFGVEAGATFAAELDPLAGQTP